MNTFALLSILLLCTVWAPSARACAVCFGDPTSPMAKGLNFGMLTLLVIVMFVLGGFGYFFLSLRRRSMLDH